MVSSKKLHFCIHGTSSIQKYLPRFLRHRGSPSFRDARHEWATIPSCDVLVPDQVRSPPPELDFSPFANPGISPQRLVDAVRDLEQFLPKGCEHLGPEDLKIIGSFPVDAGGFADVWLGERNGIAVAIKHYRHNASSDLPSIYLRMYNEASKYKFLNDRSENFVPFIGTYSTPEHPLCLVFTLMDHLNLREYLKSRQSADKLKLLLDIARGMNLLHSHGLVHGNLNISNVLVDGDGRARIGGLGTAFAPSAIPAEDMAKLFHGALAPEIIEPRRPGLVDAGSAAASDVFAFAFLVVEVFSGRPPFTYGGVHSILDGCRPDRPDELPNSVWRMVQSCWREDPAERIRSTGIVAVLEFEERADRSK